MRSSLGRGRVLGAGLVLVSALAVGCSTSDRPPVSQLHQGLNLLDVRDPSWGMNAAFVKDADVVYFESRVGALKPDVYRQSWPSDPPNETDYRFVDADGRMFYAQRGGDNFVDPSWNADFDASMQADLAKEPAHRALDFELAKEASQALRLHAPPAFQNQVFYLKHLATAPVPAQDPVLIADLARLAAQAAAETPYLAWSRSRSTSLETELYKGDTACFAWVCAGDHSATTTWYSYNGWQTRATAMTACNHGRCPGDSGMGAHCHTMGGPFATGASINGETVSNSTSVTGACQTQYSWSGIGHSHNCNDDAAYELWQTKNGKVSTSLGNGTSFVWSNNYACDCSATGCKNDWSAPSCP